MFKNILGTAMVRFINAILTLLILVVNTNYFGQEGMGTIGLLVLGISLILLVSNFVGGGALVYLTPRHETIRLFLPAYVWGIISSLAGATVLGFFHLIPGGFVVDVLILAVLQSFISANQNILLGRQKIILFNGVTLLQAGATLLALLYFVVVRHNHDVSAYIHALYVAFVCSFLLSFFSILKYLKIVEIRKLDSILIEIFKYGKFIQSANVLQLLNYRLSFYIIEVFIGRAALGIFNTATQLSEGVWLIGKSVAMIQYSSISNSNDKDFARVVTLRLFKFTFTLTFFIIFILLVLPGSVYALIFSADFIQIKMVILTLALGLLSTACSMMFSHYFSGLGMPKYNMIGSGIGLAFTLVLGLIFIPLFGLMAAGITASTAYFANLLFLILVFARKTGSSWNDFLLNKDDIRYFRTELGKLHK